MDVGVYNVGILSYTFKFLNNLLSLHFWDYSFPFAYKEGFTCTCVSIRSVPYSFQTNLLSLSSQGVWHGGGGLSVLQELEHQGDGPAAAVA